ncbi:MAG: TolC family protein [Acidobacteria bacterium]|nr:TolC family protein [Acidobacteriota bacterium]
MERKNRRGSQCSLFPYGGRLLFLAVLIVFPAPSSGQELDLPSPLSLKAAIRIALGKNPAVKAAQNGVEISQALQLDASKRLNPAFTLNTEGWRAFSPDQGPFFRTAETFALFSYEIETAGKRSLRTRAADLGVETAQAGLEDQRRLLTLQVERAYFRAVLASANLEVAQSVLGEIDRVIGLNQVRYTRGEISGGELKRSEVERLRFLDDVFAAQLELRNAKSELLALFASPDLSRDFQLGETLPVNLSQPLGFPEVSSVSSLVKLQETALRQRPDLREALREEQRADTETLHQRAIRSPNVTVQGGYKRTEGFHALALGVTVPLKVFNRNEGGIAQAEAELARARNQAELTRTALLLEIQKAYNAIQVNRERVRYLEEEYLRKSDQSREIVTASYRLGEANLIDFLDAERAYRETRRIYNQALYEYRISLYELAAAVGEGFPQ